MYNLFIMFYKKCIILIVALVCGLIYVLPNIFFINSSNFQGIPLMNTDAESLYLNKINGAYNGCTFNCNSFIKEYGYKYPHFDASISSMLLAMPGVIMNINIFDLKILYEFILPILIFLFAYFLINRIVKNRHMSVLGALFIVLGYNLLNFTDLFNIQDFINLFKLKTDETQFLIFSRPVNPQFSSLYLFVYLNILLFAIKKNTKSWYVVLGLFFGLSFYIYFFTYAYLTVLNLVFICIYLFRKEKDRVVGFSISFIIGILLSIPVLYQVISLMSHKYFTTIPHEYLSKSHMPDLSLLGLSIFLVCLALFFLIYKKSKIINNEFIFVVGLVSACFVTRNEHIVTGLIMQYSHFEMYIFSPILVIAICYFFKEIFCEKVSSRLSIVIIYLLSILCILNSILIQASSYKNAQNYSIYVQNYVPLLNWVKLNIKDSVFIAPESLSQYLPLYTKNHVFWTLYAGQWISEPDRINDVTNVKTSENILKISKKYDIDYIIQDNRDDILKQSHLKMVYKDNYFTIYEYS